MTTIQEGRQRREIAEKAGLADRRANALQGELEEARALLDSADRGKKQADMELAEARGAVNDMTTINSKPGSDKRRLEFAIHTMHAEIDDMLHQAKNSEEKAKKAMVDAARLADELRAEQEHAGSQEKAKRSLESQKAERRIKELQFQQDEDHKNQDRMSELAGKLQQKIKTYKKQIEEAEEIAALNLAKYRKAQQELEDAEERAKLAGANLTVARGGSIF